MIVYPKSSIFADEPKASMASAVVLGGVLASLVMEKAIADAILSSKITEEEYLANI